MSQKDAIVREYLRQQANMLNTNEFTDQLTNEGQINVHHNQLVPHHSSDEDLTEFKEQVKSWLNLDNEVKAINAKIKILDNERKHRKKLIEVFSAKILSFMGSNEIDELNSKDGIIKYKKSFVKEPLTQKQIREKLLDQFRNIDNAEEKIDKVFKDREKIEKLRLKRT
jgi:type II secretory pathway component GspD/PulD (secretin)